jgi:hypothetical protein
VGYAVLVGWLTWPLAASLGTHVPGVSPVAEMDTLHSLWILSWETHALSVAPAHVLDANIYHPTPHALLYSTLGLGTLPYFAPTFLLTANPVLAANLAFIACMALAAWGLDRVVRAWSGSALGAAIAACTFLLTPWVLWTWTPPRPVHFPLQYFPWIAMLGAMPGWSARRGWLLGALVVLQCAVDPLYVAPAVLAPLLAVVAARVSRSSTRADGVALARTLALALVVLAPIYAGPAMLKWANPGLESVWGNPNDTPQGRALDGFVLAGGVYADVRPTGVPWIVIPLIVVGLAAFAFGPADERTRTRRAWLHAGLWTVVGVLISTRAVIRPGDPPVTILTSPIFMLADRLAPAAVHLLRGTTRLGVGALAGLALLAGLAFGACERRLGRIGAVVGALAITGTMYAGWPGRGGPYPLVRPPATDTTIVRALRASRGPLLELPASTAPFASTEHARAMYRSIFHWRPLLNGYGSYWPAGFAERLALAARLPDADAWASLQRDTGVEAVLVHANAPRYAAWLDLVGRRAGPLSLVARDGSDLLFEATGDAAATVLPADGARAEDASP